jgi:hypothetical protein
MSGKTHVPTEVQSAHEADFRATVHLVPLGPVQVSTLTYPSRTASRSAKQVRQSDPEMYQLTVSLCGRMGIRQDGRECAVGVKEMVLYHTSSPFLGWVESPHEQCKVIQTQVPRDFVPLTGREAVRWSRPPSPRETGPVPSWPSSWQPSREPRTTATRAPPRSWVAYWRTWWQSWSTTTSAATPAGSPTRGTERCYWPSRPTSSASGGLRPVARQCRRRTSHVGAQSPAGTPGEGCRSPSGSAHAAWSAAAAT